MVKIGSFTSSGGSSRDYDWRDTPSVTKKSAGSYAKTDKRTYTGTTSKGIAPPIGKEISTDAGLAAILVVDVTGSMHKWPKLIFDKIPALYTESNVALQGLSLDDVKKKGKTVDDALEMAIIAIGDAYDDQKPLQVVDFSKGGDLVKEVNKIFPEGGGGPFGRESYELTAYYLLNHCNTPNLPKESKPILIYACDEDFYKTIKADQVKRLIGDQIQSMDTDQAIKKLAKKFDMYVLRPEPEGPNPVYDRAHEHWQNLIGKQRVLKMNDPARLIDCVIGICSYAADNFEEGVKILGRRQTASQVKQVLETLHPLNR